MWAAGDLPSALHRGTRLDLRRAAHLSRMPLVDGVEDV